MSLRWLAAWLTPLSKCAPFLELTALNGALCTQRLFRQVPLLRCDSNPFLALGSEGGTSLVTDPTERLVAALAPAAASPGLSSCLPAGQDEVMYGVVIVSGLIARLP